MVQRVATVAFEGIEVRPVDVQVQVAPGMPAFAIVGLPDKAVSEARERVRSALIASGLALPARRITINLAPADLPKEGSHYDLPIALPPLAPAELLEVSMVASIAGEIEGGALTNRRPFRAPHHSASMPALVGGGLHARPGEISLAHHGVLFLDELPEFQPQALDSLGQPLETGEVSIARANDRVTYPARFMLVAAMNPCRCGKANEPGFSCRRGPNTRCAAEYQTRLSGPLLDRIDLHIEVPAVTAADLILPPPAEGSREIAERVALARERQAARYAAIGLPHVRTNAAVAGAILEDVARPDGSGLALLREAADAMRLSARGLTAPLPACTLFAAPPINPTRCRGPRRACRSRTKIPAASRRDRETRQACGSSPW
jgi:magnesium chelatase family protein